jgi:hypothetical protein
VEREPRRTPHHVEEHHPALDAAVPRWLDQHRPEPTSVGIPSRESQLGRHKYHVVVNAPTPETGVSHILPQSMRMIRPDVRSQQALAHGDEEPVGLGQQHRAPVRSDGVQSIALGHDEERPVCRAGAHGQECCPAHGKIDVEVELLSQAGLLEVPVVQTRLPVWHQEQLVRPDGDLKWRLLPGDLLGLPIVRASLHGRGLPHHPPSGGEAWMVR